MKNLFLLAMTMIATVVAIIVVVTRLYVVVKGDRLSEENAIADAYLRRMAKRRWVSIVLVMMALGLSAIAYGLGGPVDTDGTIMIQTYPRIVTTGGIVVILAVVLAVFGCYVEQRDFEEYLARRMRREDEKNELG